MRSGVDAVFPVAGDDAGPGHEGVEHVEARIGLEGSDPAEDHRSITAGGQPSTLDERGETGNVEGPAVSGVEGEARSRLVDRERGPDEREIVEGNPGLVERA